MLSSILNNLAWERFLHQYWDEQLVIILACGFPLDFSQPENWSSLLITNHSTADGGASHINYYIDTENQLGAILGPFDSLLISYLHCSSMLTRPKSGSDKGQVIIDLSWPQGQSVNAGAATSKYLKTEFTLKFPSIDYIVQRDVNLRGNSLLFKINLKRAFRQLKLDPQDMQHTGLIWNRKFFTFTNVSSQRECL